jgi:hypothetical protein
MTFNKKHKIIVSKLNNYISNFLKDTSPELKSVWNGETNQQSFLSVIQESKNKDLPKKSKSSYIIFCTMNRENVKKTNPNIKAIEIIVELGRRWKEISDVEKEKYTVLAKEDKVRYITEMNMIGKDVSPVSIKKSNGFTKFTLEKKKELKNTITDKKEITTEIDRLWTLLSKAEKDIYEGQPVLVSQTTEPEPKEDKKRSKKSKEQVIDTKLEKSQVLSVKQPKTKEVVEVVEVVEEKKEKKGKKDKKK